MDIKTIHEDIQAQWFSFESVMQILGVSKRTARTEVAKVNPRLIRYNHNKSESGGRPEHMYHYTGLAALDSYYRTHVTESIDEQIAEAAKGGMPPDDLARAQLRLTCVKEYQARCKGMPRGEALLITANDWTKRPRERTANIDERRRRDKRKHTVIITLGSVSPSSIQHWDKLYKKGKTVKALLLSKKGRVGRKGTEIEDALLRYVLANSVSTARADVTKAVAYARKTWPGGEVPDISIRTWQRRIAALNPGKDAATLGKKGVAAYENECSPNVEMDYSLLAYNDLWQLDDVIMDFYAHRESNPEELCRPYLYAVMRVATREWIGYVISEKPITQRQVGGLLAHCFSAPEGGLPKHVTFERGSVALNDSLAETLDNLGVGWHRASIDGGRTWSGAIPDGSKGHSRAKAVLESNNRRLHNILWNMAGQIGIEERHSAPGNTEAIKSESIKRVQNGDATLLPLWENARTFIDTAIQEHNTTPHSGLPRVWDTETRCHRHATPAEYAAELAKQEKQLRIMDPYMTPAFYAEGRMVPVTKNGIKVGIDRKTKQTRSYGRFDDDLHARNGTKVTCYVLDDYPQHCYVAELGRTVELYEKQDPRVSGDQYGKKRHIDKQNKANFEDLMASSARYEQEFIEQHIATAAAANVDESKIISVTSEVLRQRVATVTQANMKQQVEEAEIQERTAMPSGEDKPDAQAAPVRRKRKSINDLPEINPLSDVALAVSANNDDDADELGPEEMEKSA